MNKTSLGAYVPRKQVSLRLDPRVDYLMAARASKDNRSKANYLESLFLDVLKKEAEDLDMPVERYAHELKEAHYDSGSKKHPDRKPGKNPDNKRAAKIMDKVMEVAKEERWIGDKQLAPATFYAGGERPEPEAMDADPLADLG